jgi:hypothetical protein
MFTFSVKEKHSLKKGVKPGRADLEGLSFEIPERGSKAAFQRVN